jgi:hypothetical protein
MVWTSHTAEVIFMLKFYQPTEPSPSLCVLERLRRLQSYSMQTRRSDDVRFLRAQNQERKEDEQLTWT